MTKYYRIKEENGFTRTVKANSSLEVIKKYDLATAKHINTRITQLEGEPLAIAQANEQEKMGW